MMSLNSKRRLIAALTILFLAALVVVAFLESSPH